MNCGHIFDVSHTCRPEDEALAGLGRLTAAAITCGALEGVALAVGIDGAVFSLGAMAGYLLLTVWLIWSGVSMVLEGRQLLRTTHLAPEQM